jgi:hypothetical protein
MRTLLPAVVCAGAVACLAASDPVETVPFDHPLSSDATAVVVDAGLVVG